MIYGKIRKGYKTPREEICRGVDRSRMGDHEGGLGKEPCAAGTVQETLAESRRLAYSTVKTTMDRMAVKGFLQIERIRNLQLFKSCISEVDARRAEFRRMLKRAFGGALTPMIRFLIEYEGFSKEEASQLRRLLDKKKTECGRKERARNEFSHQ